jgi:hypothetical protein
MAYCHPWLSFMKHVESVALCPVNGATVSLGGRYSTDYYGHAVPVTVLAICPPTLSGTVASSGVAQMVIYPLI